MSTDNGEDAMARNTSNEYRILVIGKSGNGKSSLCNTITGDRRFTVGRGLVATTTTCKEEIVFRNGTKIRVVDTPDVVNLNMTQRMMEEEVAQWKNATRPFPSAVLLTVRCDVRYTAEEHAIYRQIQRLWGDNSLQSHLVVAFTFGDMQDRPLEEELKTVCPELKSVLRDAGGRYIQFNNKAPSKQAQVDYLMNMIKTRIPGDAGPTQVPPLIKGLAAVTGIAGLCFASTFTAGKTDWAIAFGLIFVIAGLGIIAIRMKKKSS